LSCFVLQGNFHLFMGDLEIRDPVISLMRPWACFLLRNVLVPYTSRGLYKLTPSSTYCFILLSSPPMQVIALSNQDFVLLQTLCYDQWHLQKCYARLRALEIISVPADVEIYKKLGSELVSSCVLRIFWVSDSDDFFFFLSRNTFTSFPCVDGPSE
jgi:hypothetical protein